MGLFATELDEATAPFVLALDVGSTATRGALYDAHGRPVGRRAKLFHTFTAAADGTSTIDPDQVTDEIAEILAELSGRVDNGVIAGVALDTFASSMVAVDADGQALTPCYTYADGRCSTHVERLRAAIDEPELQQRTGTRVHSSYWPARLRWLAETQPDVFARTAQFLSLGDYVYRRLLGVTATGTSSAAWTGLVDRRTCDWDPATVELSGIRLDQLAPVHPLDRPIELSDEQQSRVAARWPQLAGARWFAAIADGLSANVGLGARDASVIGATGATSGALRVLVRELPDELPSGLWCYAVSDDRWLVGGALNDVGRAVAWADNTFASYRLDTRELSVALLREPEPTTPLVLPFFTGERSTGWARDARAVFAGVSASSGPIEMYRGVIEGIALAYTRVAGQLRQLATEPERIVAGGSVTAAHPEVLQIMADALRMPITLVDIKRSTLLGTALLALDTVAPGVDRVDPPAGDTYLRTLTREDYYAARLARFEQLYAALFA